MKDERWCSERMSLLLLLLMRDESGQNLIEYCLIAGVIGLGAIAASTSLRNSVATLFSAIGSQLATSS